MRPHLNRKDVLVDIDGTLAHIPTEQLEILRSDAPDWERFYTHTFEYEPNAAVCNLVRDLLFCGRYNVIFITGRSSRARERTLYWLGTHVGYSTLLMRADGDERHDTEVKFDLYLDMREDLSNIAFVLEDRDTLVDMWRELGVTCLQVERGDE